MSTVPFYAEQGTSPNDRATHWMYEAGKDPEGVTPEEWFLYLEGTAAPTPHDIPKPVFDRLQGFQSEGRFYKSFPARHWARDALREAAVRAIEEGAWTPEG